MKPVTIAIAGCGGRGTGFANYIDRHRADAKLVGVAEPIDYRREKQAKVHDIPRERVFTDWKAMAAAPKLADAVIISTQDAMHADPAVAFAKKGYHILLEKPMAPNAKDCRRIVAGVKKAGVIFGVCHVLRYTHYTREFKKMLDSGLIGEIINMRVLEPVGYWHQAHSFVRGHWRNETESSFMLLSKSCHDIDWIRHLVGSPYARVSSFGSLKHFRREEKPKGAAKRCFDCKVEPRCAYSAKKIYLGRLKNGWSGWPVSTLIDGNVTRKSLTEALRKGPYGRCVYACDNDVVDHQVVCMEFESGATATFTMTAFNRGRGREIQVFGTKGELSGDGSNITHFDFLTDKTKTIDTSATAGDISGGHGGGDEGVMSCFIKAVATGDQTKLISGADETLETHLAVFAAEKSRRTGKVVDV